MTSWLMSLQISFAFSIMGLCSSIATTFNTPLTLGGPASVTRCWILGATMCFTLGTNKLQCSDAGMAECPHKGHRRCSTLRSISKNTKHLS